jgi:hypothetical protein
MDMNHTPLSIHGMDMDSSAAWSGTREFLHHSPAPPMEQSSSVSTSGVSSSCVPATVPSANILCKLELPGGSTLTPSKVHRFYLSLTPSTPISPFTQLQTHINHLIKPHIGAFRIMHKVGTTCTEIRSDEDVRNAVSSLNGSASSLRLGIESIARVVSQAVSSSASAASTAGLAASIPVMARPAIALSSPIPAVILDSPVIPVTAAPSSPAPPYSSSAASIDVVGDAVDLVALAGSRVHSILSSPHATWTLNSVVSLMNGAGDVPLRALVTEELLSQQMQSIIDEREQARRAKQVASDASKAADIEAQEAIALVLDREPAAVPALSSVSAAAPSISVSTWPCQRCTFLNRSQSLLCEICHADPSLPYEQQSVPLPAEEVRPVEQLAPVQLSPRSSENPSAASPAASSASVVDASPIHSNASDQLSVAVSNEPAVEEIPVSPSCLSPSTNASVPIASILPTFPLQQIADEVAARVTQQLSQMHLQQRSAAAPAATPITADHISALSVCSLSDSNASVSAPLSVSALLSSPELNAVVHEAASSAVATLAATLAETQRAHLEATAQLAVAIAQLAKHARETTRTRTSGRAPKLFGKSASAAPASQRQRRSISGSGRSSLSSSYVSPSHPSSDDASPHLHPQTTAMTEETVSDSSIQTDDITTLSAAGTPIIPASHSPLSTSTLDAYVRLGDDASVISLRDLQAPLSTAESENTSATQSSGEESTFREDRVSHCENADSLTQLLPADSSIVSASADDSASAAVPSASPVVLPHSLCTDVGASDDLSSSSICFPAVPPTSVEREGALDSLASMGFPNRIFAATLLDMNGGDVELTAQHLKQFYK